jgi:hypothetical protein
MYNLLHSEFDDKGIFNFSAFEQEYIEWYQMLDEY